MDGIAQVSVRMTDFQEIAAKSIHAMTQLDSQALHESSENFLDLFAIHYASTEWTRFAATDAGVACLIGFELSHLHLGSEVGMARSILASVDLNLSSSARAVGLRNRWDLICLPLSIGNIENDWKTCLGAIAAVLEHTDVSRSVSDEFEQALFDRAGIVTFSLLKKLLNQISQFQILMGAVLTMQGVSRETQAMMAKWMFSEPNSYYVPEGFES
jgi:hypothetical protein